MKTQVIHLDSHDDIVSVRDRMSWSKAPRLLLVFPRRARILSRWLDIRLLQRHAAGLGTQLALVTRSGEVREAARGLGIPVYKNTKEAQRHPWPEHEPAHLTRRQVPPPDLRQMRQETLPAENRWRGLPVVRLGLFSLAVLAVLGLLLLFVPSATVDLKPALQTQSLTLTVGSSTDVKQINLAGSLPASVASLTLVGSKTAKASGSALHPDLPAKGLARFRNLTTSVVGIPSGTVVRTIGNPSVRFATSSDGVVAAGVSNTVDVPIQALDIGSSGNLAAGSLIAIEGELGTSLSVTNPDPTTGGEDKPLAVPTSDDRARLHDALLADLRQEAVHQFTLSHDPGDVFFPDTLAAIQVLSETDIPTEGQPGDVLTLELHLQFQVQYAKSEDIRSLLLAVMNSSLPAGFAPVSGSMSIQSPGSPVTGADGVSRWQLQAKRTLRPQIDPFFTAQMVQGLKRADASRKLGKAFPLAAQPTIRVIPTWWPWLPWIPFRIVTVVH